VTDGALAISTAAVPTNRPRRYGRQLVAHLGRRRVGGWSDATGTGWIEFDNGRAELNSSDGALMLRLESDPDNHERLQNVVSRHLVRFGARDELAIRWTRDDGSAR
jgi:hypothetical protein